MTSHSSATTRQETPHTGNTNTNNNLNLNGKTISAAIRRQAQAVVNDRTVDAQSRALIRYALEINDPSLAELVRRADAGEPVVDALEFDQTSKAGEDDSSREKIEALAEMICGGGEESSAALLVLMATIENATHPKALANTAKHLAFTRCSELNVSGMVDAQIEVLEAELFA